MLILRIHKLIYLLLVLILASCEKEDENLTGETIPSYIQIDAISIEDVNDTEKITDAWVYINDQLQGVYELPALFPVLSTGKQNIRIKGGIKNNGISSSRRAYPFYKSFIQEENLKADQITSMYPIVSYIDSTNIIGNSILNIDTTYNSHSPITYIEDTEGEGTYSKSFLTGSLLVFEAASSEIKNLPKGGSDVFLELDYKCNTRLLIGVFANNANSVVKNELVWVTPKQDWNKIYIDLTKTISESINANSFTIFIKMERDVSLDTNEIYFDNIKVVY